MRGRRLAVKSQAYEKHIELGRGRGLKGGAAVRRGRPGRYRGARGRCITRRVSPGGRHFFFSPFTLIIGGALRTAQRRFACNPCELGRRTPGNSEKTGRGRLDERQVKGVKALIVNVDAPLKASK